MTAPAPSPALAAAPGGDARERLIGQWLVFAAAFFWGTSATLARFVFHQRHVPALTVVELRLSLAALVLGTWLALRNRRAFRIERREWRDLVVLGVFGLAAVQGSYYYTISVLGVGLAILIQYLAPALIVAYDAFRSVPIHRITVVAVVAAIVGTALLVTGVDASQLHARPHHWLIGFASAVIFAFYILYSKRRLSAHAPETVLFYTFCVAATFWAFVTPPWVIARAGYGADLWGMFILLALFSTLVPFACFYAGLRRLDPTRAGIIATLEPVIAVISAATFLGEGLRPMQTCGAALVLAAAATISSRPDQLAAASSS